MGSFSVFDISATGLTLEKTKLETVATNLANVNVANKMNLEAVYKPKRVLATEVNFDKYLESQIDSVSPYRNEMGTEIIAIEEMDIEPRQEYDPGHPYADEKGFVLYPNINLASEMIIMMESVRAYEANVKAISASKAMINSALEIGRR